MLEYAKDARPVRWQHAFCQAPPLWMLGVAAAVAGYITYLRSITVRDSFAFIGNGGAACSAVLVGALLVADFAIRLARCFKPQSGHRPSWRWFVTPALAVLTLITWQTRWPLRLRFERDRAALEALAEELLATQAAASRPYGSDDHVEFEWRSRHAGDQFVDGVAIFPEERVVFLVTGGFLRSAWGFVYCPNGNDPTLNPERDDHKDIVVVKPLAPGWMTFFWATP